VHVCMYVCTVGSMYMYVGIMYSLCDVFIVSLKLNLLEVANVPLWIQPTC